jgi:uncharacterized FlaG/YvyC family protein
VAIDTVSTLVGANQPAVTAAFSKVAAAPAAPPVSAPSEADIQRAAQEIQSRLQESGLAVEVSVDMKSELRVVTIRDSANGSVIRQFPSEQAIWLTQHLNEGSALLREIA